MENKFGNILTILLIVAIVIIVAILGFFAYRIYVNDKINKEAGNTVADFDKNTSTPNGSDSSNNNPSINDGENSSLGNILNNLGTDNNQNSIYQQQTNNDTYYEGYKVMGTIAIPSINIEYPILEHFDDTLKIAIVATYPQDPENAVNKPGNLVLWGHNYKNGTFFSDIGKLTTGAKIYIKDKTGTRVEYQVYNVYDTTDSDFTYATRNTDGAREISLSTCDNDSGRRTVVWARELK